MDLTGWFFIMAYKGNREVYIATCPERVVEVTDYLSDNGYRAGQLAKWFYMQKLQERDAVCYHIENDGEDFYIK